MEVEAWYIKEMCKTLNIISLALKSTADKEDRVSAYLMCLGLQKSLEQELIANCETLDDLNTVQS